MRDTPPESKQLFSRVPVFSILPDCIVHRLFGEAVFQFEREHGHPVDEQADVQRPLRLVPAVAKLAGDREAVLFEAFLRAGVVGRRRAVEQIQVQRSVLDPVAQHVDGAALVDLALQPIQKRAPRRSVLGKRERLGGFGLGYTQECRQLHQIDAILPIVIVGIAATPANAPIADMGFCHGARGRRLAGIARQAGANQAFKSAFGGVCVQRKAYWSVNGFIIRRPS